ncbi:MAG: metal-dependent transcriptional regulator [Clostridia bacterium]|nr:metal-dependent transcriptional regulator [Clostridia bacterium]
MYLETIYVLTLESSYVRAVDVGDKLGYSKPSVSRAMGLLKNGGYINIAQDGNITLTDIGRETAEKIYDRHSTLTEFLLGLGVDEDTASADACRIEHVISDTAFLRIKEYLKKQNN